MPAEKSRFVHLLLLCSYLASAQTAQPTKPEDRCTIEGTISSLKTGQPLGKAEVVLRRSQGNLQTTYSATTDAAGNYSIENMEAGKYSLRVSRNGYVSTSYGSQGKQNTFTLITLAPAQHMTKGDVRLPSQAAINGRVVDQDGEPMARVRVQLMSRGYNNGRLFLMQGESAATVSGRLINSPKNRNVNVKLMPFDTGGAVSWSSSKLTMPDGEGKYAFRGVQPGSYYLTASVFSEEDRSSARSEVTVSDSNVDVPLVFGQNPNIRGTVRSDDPSEPLRPDLKVTLQPEVSMIGVAPAEVNGDGSFTLKSVPPELLRLTLFPMPDGHYIKSIQFGDGN